MSKRRLIRKLENSEGKDKARIQRRIDFMGKKEGKAPESKSSPIPMPRGGMNSGMNPITPDNAFGPIPNIQDGLGNDGDRTWGSTTSNFKPELADLLAQYAQGDTKPKHLQGRGTMIGSMKDELMNKPKKDFRPTMSLDEALQYALKGK